MKIACVTGASSGIGLEVAQYLVRAGYIVFAGSRHSTQDTGRKHQKILSNHHGQWLPWQIDLASLQSVIKASRFVKETVSHLDLLINNAGVMAPLSSQKTQEGFDRQFGVNHLGHFALSYYLKDYLCAGDGKIVNVSSLAAGRISAHVASFKNTHKKFNRWTLYQRSKLANLLFTKELNQKAKQWHWNLHARAAHPGWARTSITQHRFSQDSTLRKTIATFGVYIALKVFGQSAQMGAKPIIYAALAPLAKDGAYYGPDGWCEHRGYPKEVAMPKAANNRDAQKALWILSEKMTGCHWS